jgi:hypothetical protein
MQTMRESALDRFVSRNAQRIPTLGSEHGRLDFSVLEKHFLDIPAFPLHVVSHWADGDVEDAAFTSGLSG